MRKKRKNTARNLSLPMWLKLRMDDSLFGQVKWMIDSAEKCNADSVRINLWLKHRPWIVTLGVKRYGN